MAFLIARINLLIFFSEQCLPQSFAATLIVKKITNARMLHTKSAT